MSVIALLLDPDAQARVLLRHLLEAGDIVGRHSVGRTVIQVAADDWLFEQLMALHGGSEDLEDEANPDSSAASAR